jgi:hypothetical protein
MKPLAQSLAASPELFPAALDPRSGVVTLWRLSAADYMQSAFLDGRIASGKASRQLPFAELARAVEEAALPESCHFIFHIGHVGSTLLSRLLGRHPNLFLLREPEILRTFSTIEKNRRAVFLPSLLQLWSRTFEPSARAVIKTTSFVSEMSTDLLSRPYGPKAIMMAVAPEIYLATILGGENTPAEARALAPFRLSRVNRRLHTSWKTEDLSDGEMAAMAWACEALCLTEATQAQPANVLVFDFDKFLAGPHEMLRKAFAHLGVRPTQSEIRAILDGGDMQSYSKAPEYKYDNEMRLSVIEEARGRHGEEIQKGLAWLDRLAATHLQIENAIGFLGQ